MAKRIQHFWSLIPVSVCYALAMSVLVYGSEEVPRWAFSLVTLTFTAIFLVGLQMGLNAQTNDSQGQEK